MLRFISHCPLRFALICAVLMLIPFASEGRNTRYCDSLIKSGVDKMFDRQYLPAMADLTKARQIAQSANWYKQQFLATNNIGLTYFKMLDYGNAVAEFLTAYELAISNKAPVDEMTVLNNIAIVYIRDNNLSQAQEYFLKSYRIAVQQKIPSRIGLYASNLAQLNLEMNNLEAAENYVNIALPNLAGEPNVLLNANIVKSMLLLKYGKVDEAIQSSILLLEEAKLSGYREEATEINILLAKAYGKMGQWRKAGFYAQNALQDCGDNELKIKIYQELAHIAVNTFDISHAVAAKDSVIALTNAINRNKNKELLDNSKLRFELSSSQHALEISQTRAQNQKIIYTIILLLLIPVILVLVWALHKKSLLAKQKRTIAENHLRIIDLELEKEKIQTSLLSNQIKEKELLTQLEMEKQKEEEARLYREIELKNKQLSEKILFQSTRNELIEEIIRTIPTLPNMEHNETLIKVIHELKIHLKEDTKWEEFAAHFENVNNEFIKALRDKHADLNANDIRFLSFVYLNTSNKEIAALLNITPEGCRKRKERITAKLNLDAGTSLFGYLSKL